MPLEIVKVIHIEEASYQNSFPSSKLRWWCCEMKGLDLSQSKQVKSKTIKDTKTREISYKRN